jgi:hypothetical protein
MELAKSGNYINDCKDEVSEINYLVFLSRNRHQVPNGTGNLSRSAWANRLRKSSLDFKL